MAIPFFIQHNRAGVVIDRLVAFAVDYAHNKFLFKSRTVGSIDRKAAFALAMT